jgi:hypothetical protein
VGPKRLAKDLDIGRPPNNADEFVALAAPEDNLFYTFWIQNTEMRLGIIQREEDRVPIKYVVIVPPPTDRTPMATPRTPKTAPQTTAHVMTPLSTAASPMIRPPIIIHPADPRTDHVLHHEKFPALRCSNPQVAEIIKDISIRDISETATFHRKLGRLLHDLGCGLQKDMKLKEGLRLARFIKRNRYYSLSSNILDRIRRGDQASSAKLLPDNSTGSRPERRAQLQSFVTYTDFAGTSSGMEGEYSIDQSSDDDLYPRQYSISPELESKLKQSKAFVSFVRQFCALFQPYFKSELWDFVSRRSRRNSRYRDLCAGYSLSEIAAQIEDVPPQDLSISFSSNRGALNRSKGSAEFQSGQTCQWWPLTPYENPSHQEKPELRGDVSVYSSSFGLSVL